VVIEKPTHQYLAGSYAHILFQQNLNHWTPPKQGFMELAMSKDASPSAPDDWRVLATVPDWPGYEMVRQTNFTMGVLVPEKPCAHCILRMRYVSYNKLEIDPPNNTDAIFYNCADIEIVAAQPQEQSIVEAPIERPAAAYSCTTPPVWSMVCSETNFNGVITHSIWWDSVRKSTRWDMHGNLWGPEIDELSLINNYTDPPVEYVNFITGRKKCYQYGNDEFYPWSYGASNGQTYAGRSGTIDSWTRPGGFSWWTKEDSEAGECRPIGWSRGAGFSAVCADFGTAPLPPDIFKPDPSCLKNPAFGGCRARQLKEQWDRAHK